jgi:hypothetical protein
MILKWVVREIIINHAAAAIQKPAKQNPMAT